jgi:hypothetical protein
MSQHEEFLEVDLDDPNALEMLKGIKERMLKEKEEEFIKKSALEAEELARLQKEQELTRTNTFREGEGSIGGQKNKSSHPNEFSYDYDRTTPSNQLIHINHAKAPEFNGTDFASWKFKMKLHLITSHPALWEIVKSGVDFDLNKSNRTAHEERVYHINMSASHMILGALSPSIFHKVNGMEEAKKIWTQLEIIHEGDFNVRESRRENLVAEIGRFVKRKGESIQDMFDRLMILIHEVRALGSNKFEDLDVVRIILRSLQSTHPTQVLLLRKDPRFLHFTPNDILSDLLASEIMDEGSKKLEDVMEHGERNMSSKNIALKAKQIKQEMISRQEESEEEDDEATAMMVKNFRKFLNFSKNPTSSRSSKKTCFECGSNDHFVANCPKKKNKEGKPQKEKNFKKKYASLKKKVAHHAHLGMEWESGSEDEDEEVEEEQVATFACKKKATTPTSLFGDVTDDEGENDAICLMAKCTKVTKPSSTHNDDFDDEEYASDLAIFKNLNPEQMLNMQTLFKRFEEQIEMNNDLAKELDLAKARNSDLETSLALEKEKSSTFNAISKLTIEKLKRNNLQLQESLTSSKANQKALEEEVASLKLKNKSFSNDKTCSSNVQACLRCKDIDINACGANSQSMQDLKIENERLVTLLAQGGNIKSWRDQYALYKAVNPNYKHNVKEGLGYVFDSQTMGMNNAKQAQGAIKFTASQVKEFEEQTQLDNEDHASKCAMYENMVQELKEKVMALEKEKSPIIVDEDVDSLVKKKSVPKPNIINKKKNRKRSRKNKKKTWPWKQVDGHAPHESFDASYVLKRDYYGNVIAKFVGKKDEVKKENVWVPKALISKVPSNHHFYANNDHSSSYYYDELEYSNASTNMKGPKLNWVPKSKI